MTVIDRPHLRAFVKEAASHPGPRHEKVRSNGSRLVLERNPESEVRELVTEVEPDGTIREHIRTFAPTGERPATYPERFPFLPNRTVSVEYLDDRGESTWLTWMELPDPGAVTRELVQLQVSEGWELEHSIDSDVLGPITRLLHVVTGFELGSYSLARGSRRRHIQLLPSQSGPGSVTLWESRRDGSGRVVRGPGAGAGAGADPPMRKRQPGSI